MLISLIQMGHLQSVREWIKNIKYCGAAQDLNYKPAKDRRHRSVDQRRLNLCLLA